MVAMTDMVAAAKTDKPYANDHDRWAALVERDVNADRNFYYSVATTGGPGSRGAKMSRSTPPVPMPNGLGFGLASAAVRTKPYQQSATLSVNVHWAPFWLPRPTKGSAPSCSTTMRTLWCVICKTVPPRRN
jgi:hypothetical protein